MSGRVKLPWDVKQQCVWIVRGYERTRREYLRARREILDAGPGDHAERYTENGEERAAIMPAAHNPGRTAENIALRLEALEHTPAFLNMRAVEHARAKIGEGLPEALADELREGILLNCMSGRKYPFERLYIVGLSRSDFYRHRDLFFYSIAEERGMI